MKGILTLILQPSQPILFFTWEIPLWLQWKPREEGGIFSPPEGSVLPLDVQMVFLWKAGLREQRLASIEDLWNFHSEPQEAPVPEQIWLCFCNAVLSKPAKMMGKLSSDFKKHWVRLILHAYFSFPKHSCWEAVQIGCVWWVFPGNRSRFQWTKCQKGFKG